MKYELLFKNLFQQALNEWPESLNLVLQTQILDEVIPTDKGYDLMRYKDLPWNKNFEKYIVKDLYELYQRAEEKYISHPKEVLMRELHSSTYYAIKDIAKYSTYIELKDLRPEFVQKKYENNQNEFLNNEKKYKEDGWKDEDFQLVRDYFSVNHPSIK